MEGVKTMLCGALVAVLLFSICPPASAGPRVSRGRDRAVTIEDRRSEVAYWTAARMARATPLGARTGVAEVPAARPVAGSRVLGALFFRDGAGGHYCTASVVRASKRNLLITAAHCLYNPEAHQWHTHIVFVPMYSRGRRPYGTWPVWLMVADKRWLDRGDPDLDYGFAAVQVMAGRRIEDVVGANQLQIPRAYSIPVLVAGYPAKVSYPADRPIGCAGRTFRQARSQLRFDCHGFYGGTSGSPWLSDYDNRSQTGHVVGVIGGYQQGGSEEWRSYSPLFNADTAHLLETADSQSR
jgi:V8-like Glu-specific endopeptidase